MSIMKVQKEDLEGSESSAGSEQVSAVTGLHSSSDDSRKEKRVVIKLKILMLFVMALTAIGFSAICYLMARNGEREEFETQFYDFAEELVEFAKHEVQSVVYTAQNMATTITSHVVDTRSMWPEIVVPHFELQGMSLSQLTRVQQLTIAPLVDIEFLDKWEWFALENKGWIQQGVNSRLGNESTRDQDITNFVYRLDGDSVVPQTGLGIDGKYAPVWQQYPAPSDDSTNIINMDLFSHPSFEKRFRTLAKTNLPVLSEIIDLNFLLLDDRSSKGDFKKHTFLMHPLYSGFSDPKTLVGFLVSIFSWDDIFDKISHPVVEKVSIVLHSTCGDIVTYETDGYETVLVSVTDAHDKIFDHLEFAQNMTEVSDELSSSEVTQCIYGVRIYPTSGFRDQFFTGAPILYAVLAVWLFGFTTVVFGVYDYIVQKRQHQIIEEAERAKQIVSELFPRNVKDRLFAKKDYKDNARVEDLEADNQNGLGAISSHTRGSIMTEKSSKSKSKALTPYETKPIADLFPNSTVMFADIVGFTAWSSIREPTQVFTLLETLYHSFDMLAKRRRVFKVETVGDCYVAVTGLPEPRADHAIVMARFAKDCIKKMNELTQQLEKTLGPDTADLSMRVGLHSGPVTAGVLRGEKSRFQLFGDTVNTAARIEATGQSNRIHMSQDTADLLLNAGKSHWIKQRDNTITPKGKGEMQTFWLESDDQNQVEHSAGMGSPTTSEHESVDDSDDESSDESDGGFGKLGMEELGIDSEDFDERTQSLVSWNADVLLKILKQIVARRVAVSARNKEKGAEVVDSTDPVLWPKTGMSPIEEVKEIIHLPEFDAFVAKHEPDAEAIEIEEEVVGQLNDFVRIIASMYRFNPFHNFEHASHVAMSVAKLLSRIVAPTAPGLGESSHHTAKDKSSLHDHTYGITSDPLTQFACVLAALIHDADHPGVPNAQLVKEKAYIARVYNNQSVAEQNSVDSAWDLLMDVNFRQLRLAICVNEDEQKRFRQLVVNAVMATDICDKELKTLRNNRWDKAFSETASNESERDRVNRKATIVIEHLIQASDIAHTMQHWKVSSSFRQQVAVGIIPLTILGFLFLFCGSGRHIYRKWNECLYQELLLAYKKGRSDVDPGENWYKGELGFFDFYIIPLAKKLKECGVFGVSCDEYLNYAKRNREHWEQKGQEIVASMIEKYRNIDNPQTVQLDGIQDSDGSALRSSLLSSETEHASSHVTRAMHENLLDMDAVSVNTSRSFATSAGKSYDGNKSCDGNKSFASGTIFEEVEENWENTKDMELVDEDDFYSDEDSSNCDSIDVSKQSNDSRKKAERDTNTRGERSDSHINMLITTGSSRSFRGSASKSLRKSASQGGDKGSAATTLLTDRRFGESVTKAPRSSTTRGRDKDKAVTSRPKVSEDVWGQKSGDSFYCDETETDSTALADYSNKTLSDNSKSTMQEPSTTQTSSHDNASPKINVKCYTRTRSDTACSTTVATTEWSQESFAEARYTEVPVDDMEGMDLYCLQQRINSRLVGNSIRNSRAFDKKPPLEEMTFF